MLVQEQAGGWPERRESDMSDGLRGGIEGSDGSSCIKAVECGVDLPEARIAQV